MEKDTKNCGSLQRFSMMTMSSGARPSSSQNLDQPQESLHATFSPTLTKKHRMSVKQKFQGAESMTVSVRQKNYRISMYHPTIARLIG